MPRQDHDDLRNPNDGHRDIKLPDPPSGWTRVVGLRYALERHTYGHAGYRERVSLQQGVVMGRRYDAARDVWQVTDPDQDAAAWLLERRGSTMQVYLGPEHAATKLCPACRGIGIGSDYIGDGGECRTCSGGGEVPEAFPMGGTPGGPVLARWGGDAHSIFESESAARAFAAKYKVTGFTIEPYAPEPPAAPTDYPREMLVQDVERLREEVADAKRRVAWWKERYEWWHATADAMWRVLIPGEDVPSDRGDAVARVAALVLPQARAPQGGPAGLSTPEPAPRRTDGRPVWDLVMDDMRQRDTAGRRKYGTPLQAFNGRRPLVDAYQEALDLVVYMRQAIEEAASPPHGEPAPAAALEPPAAPTEPPSTAEIAAAIARGELTLALPEHDAQQETIRQLRHDLAQWRGLRASLPEPDDLLETLRMLRSDLARMEDAWRVATGLLEPRPRLMNKAPDR